ncbi:MAG TPA: PEP-CTERM sorting domain-containing protein [Candidatus Sulfotelmatobacter sp.]|nr:PEP-CTERM sorting domain-containing protein [Candidatus Sulfotelmatobacter sp.]
MGKLQRLGLALAMACFALVPTAKGDGTLDYILTLSGSSSPLATWTMSQTPTPTCPAEVPPSPCFASGEFFAEIVDLSLNGGPATPDTLVFFNSTFTTVDLNDLNFSIPEFDGMQLNMNDESAPTMKTGSFELTDDGTNGVAGAMYTLTVTATTPEPGTLLLLGSGVLTLWGGIRRRISVSTSGSAQDSPTN